MNLLEIYELIAANNTLFIVLSLTWVYLFNGTGKLYTKISNYCEIMSFR